MTLQEHSMPDNDRGFDPENDQPYERQEDHRPRGGPPPSGHASREYNDRYYQEYRPHVHNYEDYHGIPYPMPTPPARAEQPDILEGTKITTGKAISFALAFSGVVATEYVKLNNLENAVSTISLSLVEIKSNADKQGTFSLTVSKDLEFKLKEYAVETERRSKEATERTDTKIKDLEEKTRENKGLVSSLENAINSRFNEMEKNDLKEKAEENERLQYIENRLRTVTKKPE